MLSSVAQDLSSRVVTRARVGFRARVTYFELGCPETILIRYYHMQPRTELVSLRAISCGL